MIKRFIQNITHINLVFIISISVAVLTCLAGTTWQWLLVGGLAFAVSILAVHALLRRIRQLERRVDRQRHLLVSRRASQRLLHDALDNGNSQLWEWQVTDSAMLPVNGWKPSQEQKARSVPTKESEWLRRIHPDDRMRVLEHLKRHLANIVDEFDIEYRMAMQPGGWRWTHTRGRVVDRDMNGRARRIVGTHTDIEREKQLEETLHQREVEFASIIKRIPDGMVYIGSDGQIQDVNTAFLAMTGFAREYLIGLTEAELDERLATHSDKGVRQQSCARCPFTREAHPSTACHGCRIDLRVSHGRRILRRTRILLTPQSQTAIHHFSDITLSAELERAKTEFMASAAQQLRAPLASMYGFSELLAGDEFDTDTQRDLIETIYKQTQTLVNLVNELLDLKRMSLEKDEEGAFEILDLASLVEDTISACRIQYGMSPFLLQCPPAKNHQARILGDPNTLRQALRNILDNAVHFSPPAAPIGVRVDIESSHEHHETVRVRISDHGSGMSAEEIEQIFDPFYRARGSLGNEGLGLGMTVVKRIIDLHNGNIHISSTPGKGTMVQLQFPVAKVNHAQA